MKLVSPLFFQTNCIFVIKTRYCWPFLCSRVEVNSPGAIVNQPTITNTIAIIYNGWLTASLNDFLLLTEVCNLYSILLFAETALR